MSTTARHSVRAATEDASVTPLELFFDLVFVYALTQVTALMADDPSGEGVLHGMIVLALFWWAGWGTRGSATRSRPTRGSRGPPSSS